MGAGPEDDGGAFFARYGTWDPLPPAELAGLLDGFDRPWWLVGGHALEAFTGVPRRHEDIDLAVFVSDVPALCDILGRHFHLWSNHGGTFRPLDEEHPEPLDPLAQIWMRVDAFSPWRVDCIPSAGDESRWVSRRDPAVTAPLDEVTWVADDGIRHLAPELVLWFKAKHARPKDEADLAATWPLLDGARRDRFRALVGRTHPGHPWLERRARS